MPAQADELNDAYLDQLGKGALFAVADLIEEGADPTLEVKGQTALSLASDKDCHLLEVLVARKVDLEVPDEFGRTALMNAAWRSTDPRNVEVLLKAGAKVNAQSPSGNTPLHYALISGDPRKIKLLLDAGADVKQVNKLGLSAMAFSRAVPGEAVDALKQKGASLDPPCRPIRPC